VNSHDNLVKIIALLYDVSWVMS